MDTFILSFLYAIAVYSESKYFPAHLHQFDLSWLYKIRYIILIAMLGLNYYVWGSINGLLLSLILCILSFSMVQILAQWTLKWIKNSLLFLLIILLLNHLN